jgi:hypothetical protein
MHATVQQILQLDSPKVRIHPLDGRRVMPFGILYNLNCNKIELEDSHTSL